MLQQRSCEPITSTGYNERLIVFISSVKKMFKMFTVGENGNQFSSCKCRELQIYKAVNNRLCISLQDICCQP